MAAASAGLANSSLTGSRSIALFSVMVMSLFFLSQLSGCSPLSGGRLDPGDILAPSWPA